MSSSKAFVRAALSGGLILLAAVAALSSLASHNDSGKASAQKGAAKAQPLGGALKAVPSAQLFIAQPAPHVEGPTKKRVAVSKHPVAQQASEHQGTAAKQQGKLKESSAAEPAQALASGGKEKSNNSHRAPSEHHGRGTEAQKKGLAKQAALKRLAEKKANHNQGHGFSTQWERSADDAFFNSLDKRRETDEDSRLKRLKAKHADEAQRDEARLRAEHNKIAREEEAAKLRFGREQAAAKAYTKKTFAKIADQQKKINTGSLSGFKGLEARELAQEIERDHPNESANQIADRALNLLHVVLKQQPSLPSASLSVGQDPLHP